MADESTSPASANPVKISTDLLPAQWLAQMDETKRLREEERAGLFAVQLAAAQAQFTPIKRNRTVRVRMKSGGEYEFAYATLDVIFEATLPALNAAGLALTQAIVKGEKADYVRTTLLGQHGERFNMTPIFPAEAGPQAYNSALTYARRAGATLLLSLAAEEDDDANRAEGHEAEQIRGKKGGAAKQPAPAAPAKGTRLVLDPGETSHLQSAEDQLAERAVVGATRDAFPGNGAHGRPRDAYGRRAEQPAAEPTGEALVIAEGKIADAIQEFHEAAIEGRRGGIESIWEEIRHDEFLATETWNRLKEQFPDSFATVSAVLRPKRDPQPPPPKAPAGKARK